MLRIPVQQHKPFKLELCLQQAIHEPAVLAGVCAVDAVVRTHDGANTSFDAVHERPEVEFVQGLVVDIGRGGFDAKVRSAEGFLLIADEMLHVGEMGQLS